MTHPADHFPQIAGSAYSTLDTLHNSYDLGYKVGMGVEGDIV